MLQLQTYATRWGCGCGLEMNADIISSNGLEVASLSLRAVLPLWIYLCVCASGLRVSLANSTICVYFGKAGSVRE